MYNSSEQIIGMSFMDRSISLTIVIPTYNSRETIIPLIESIADREKSVPIIVCDDASTDDTPHIVSQHFGSRVRVIAGTRNLGPGGNRNRVLRAATGSGLFFIDADCSLIYKKSLTQLSSAQLRGRDTGAVGFGIQTLGHQPMPWNFGTLMHPLSDANDRHMELLWRHGKISKALFIEQSPTYASSLRLVAMEKPSVVGWVSEACFAIKTELFRALGGFDSTMRYHEAHDLHMRIQKRGFKTVFVPTPVVVHLESSSRIWRRDEDDRQGRYHYFHKHWSMTKKTFSLLFD